VFAQVFDAETLRPQVVVVAHSFTSAQVVDSPLPAIAKPAVQPQANPPTELVQVFDADRF